MSSLAPVNFTISAACLKELSTALGAATGTDPKTVTVTRPCAEETWNALMTALKGPAPAAKKKGGKTTTSVRQKSGRPTGSSARSGKGS
jgi:hypothetical protein